MRTTIDGVPVLGVMANSGTGKTTLLRALLPCLRAAGLRVIDTMLVSYTEMIANQQAFADPEKRHAMNQLMTLLLGTLDARGKVLVKLNVGTDDLQRVLNVLPSAKSPTISELASGGFAVESVVEKRTINTLIPALKDAGASDLLEMPISKIVA